MPCLQGPSAGLSGCARGAQDLLREVICLCVLFYAGDAARRQQKIGTPELVQCSPSELSVA